MKIPLIYGALMALVGALIQYGLFFAGFHDSPEKLQAAQWIATVVGSLAAIAGLALAMRDRRAQAPLDQPWGYGSAVVSGVLVGIVAAFAGAIFTYIYMAVVNPNFSEVVYQAQVAKMEAKGMNASDIETASSITKTFLSAPAMALFQIVGGVFWSTVISLIVAIFFRTREVPAPESEAGLPPPLTPQS